MKKWLRGAAAAVALLTVTMTAEAADFLKMEIPEDIFCSLQSTERMNYYINKQEITYAVDETGKPDYNVLMVPVIKNYDSIQVKDITEKRKWNDESMEMFEFLTGEADYLRLDLAARTVLVRRIEFLTYSMTLLDTVTPNKVLEIDKLSEKNVERRFYEAIVKYESEHVAEVLKNTKRDRKTGQVMLTEKELEKCLSEHKKARKELARKEAHKKDAPKEDKKEEQKNKDEE